MTILWVGTTVFLIGFLSYFNQEGFNSTFNYNIFTSPSNYCLVLIN